MPINGYRNPVFHIYTAAGAWETAISLPLTNTGGLVEGYEIKKIEHELLNYSVESEIKGFKIFFTLNYDEHISGEALMSIKSLLEYARAGYKLYLIPRAEIYWRSFEVYVSMNNFEVGIRRGGAKAKYNRMVLLEFATKHLQTSLNWVETGSIQYGAFYFTKFLGTN